jgi:TorA maturation chaperone TorD
MSFPRDGVAIGERSERNAGNPSCRGGHGAAIGRPVPPQAPRATNGRPYIDILTGDMEQTMTTSESQANTDNAAAQADLSEISVLHEVLAGRSAFYQTLAGFYYAPLTEEQVSSMAAASYSGFGAGDPLLEEGFNDISRYLRKRHTGTRQQLATDYTMSFGGVDSIEGKTAVPYASVFLSDTGLLQQEPRNEVFKVFKKEALRLRSKIDLPEDHITFEFEFLSILSDRADEALSIGDLPEASRLLTLSKDFINQNILSWFDQLADLTNQIITTRFYRGVLKITKGYLLLDIQTLDDLIEVISSDAA